MSVGEGMETRPPEVIFGEAFRFWLKLGFISFGGPAGQIAIMHQELVERRRWISERRFLHALNYCMVLPGPEAQQLATYIGWLMHRSWGGIVAGVLFVLPSLFILIGLSWIYVAFGHTVVVSGLFYGIKPAVTAIVLYAAHRIGSRALRSVPLWAIAGGSFLAIFALDVPFPAIVAGAALIGYIGGRVAPAKFQSGGGHGKGGGTFGPALIDDDTPTPEHVRLSWGHVGRSAGVGVVLWMVPMACLTVRYGWDATLADGLVLHQGCAPDLWRCVRRASLRSSRRGRSLRLVDGGANDGWLGTGRNDAGSANYGGRLRRIRGRLPECALWSAAFIGCGCDSGRRRHLVHVPAIFCLHPRGRTDHRIDSAGHEGHRAADGNHGCGCRGHSEPCLVLRIPRALARRSQGTL